MEISQRASRSIARRSLLLVLGAAVVAWLLFVAGVYVDMLPRGAADAYATDAESRSPEFSRYFMFAAVAVLGLGSLIALRRTSGLRARGAQSALVRPVQLFAGGTLIVAASISASICMVLFFDGFLGGSGAASPLTQTVDLYVPIVLHTALVVTLVLAGFVFVPRGGPVPTATPATVAPSAQELAQSPHSEALQHSTPVQHSTPLPHSPESLQAQRSAARGFAVPLVTASAALIAGLIVADLTGSATQVWLWTLVLAVIGGGIVAGTISAARALAQQSHSQRPRGAAVGAKNLNFVLSIVLVGSAAILALGYGSSAVNALTSSPWLSVGVFESGPGNGVDGEPLTWTASGGDLELGTSITVTMQPADIELDTVAVGRDGWGDISGTLPAEDEPGDYVIEAHALTEDGRELKASASFGRNADGVFMSGESADAYVTAPALVSPISAHWVFSDLLPAGLLLLIAAAVTGLSITARARERQAVPSVS
ncbi:hypothetical protein [Leucobacter salsicius]|uniref:hypothetical protein n=1 Tax=Leucobacter salsicius TaxID=664638 RepID=UPI0003468053|nr:hypothetical protein [Leucobacter salsicius]